MNKIKELKYGNTKCYCINDKIIIDTDWAGTLQAFYQCIKEQSIALKEVEYLLITHFHPDHMGIAQDLAQIGIKIVVFEEQRNYIHISDPIFAKEKNRFYKPIEENSVVFISCAESRQFLCKLGIAGEVMSTPGHSDDSISILLDEGIAIVGDLPPLYSVPAYGNILLETSWNSILARKIKCVYYSHAKEDIVVGITCVDDILH